MKFMLVTIALAAGVYFAVQTPAARNLFLQVKASGAALANNIVGNMTR